MINFCTLFDSYYLDKGIALYRSLESVSSDFTLYIFCFDEKSHDILRNLNFEHAVILHNSVFETPQLLELKKEISDLTQTDLEYIGRFAVTAASLSTEHSGGIPSIQPINSVLEHMK